MSITVAKDPNNYVVITITGVLSYIELEEIQNLAIKMVKSTDKLNCLLLADKFSGWGKDGDWGDLTFMYESDSMIGKIAVVAKENWKDQILMFLGAGRRGAQVDFFFPGEEDDARRWLCESDS